MSWWKDEGDCFGDPLENYFEKYEADPEQAIVSDWKCFGCKVRRTCLEEAIENDATGLHGGAYLVLGKYNKQKNKHKTPEVNQALMQEVEEIRDDLYG